MGWIKMKEDLPNTTAFIALTAAINRSDAETLTSLYMVACWFAQHSDYGRMSEADAAAMDDFIDLPGFADALAGVGWLRSGHGQVWLTGFCQPCANRKGIAASVRADVLATGACEACGSGDEPEIDHDVPISRGGSCDRSNLQRLCSSCNRAKGRRTMAEFMAARSGSA